MEPPDYPIDPAPGQLEMFVPPGIEELYEPTEICFSAPSVLDGPLQILGTTTLVPGGLALVVKDRIGTYAILQGHPELPGMLCIIRIIHTTS
jgi:hypothetical protein